MIHNIFQPRMKISQYIKENQFRDRLYTNNWNQINKRDYSNQIASTVIEIAEKFPVDSPLYISVAFALLLPDFYILQIWFIRQNQQSIIQKSLDWVEHRDIGETYGDGTRRFGKDAGNETDGEQQKKTNEAWKSSGNYHGVSRDTRACFFSDRSG